MLTDEFERQYREEQAKVHTLIIYSVENNTLDANFKNLQTHASVAEYLGAHLNGSSQSVNRPCQQCVNGSALAKYRVFRS